MIFLYHRVVSDDSPPGRFWNNQSLRLNDFRSQLDWLTRRFQIVPLEDYLSVQPSWSSRLAALTIDDGLARTMNLVLPELAARRLQATVFLPTGHLVDDQVYWFAYLDALCFESQRPSVECGSTTFGLHDDASRRTCRRALGRQARESGRPSEFIDNLRRRYPLHDTLTDEYRSVRRNEIQVALESGCVRFGSHSVRHPYLDALSRREQLDEMTSSKAALEQATGATVSYFAYPAGAYNEDSVSAAKDAGYAAALACAPHRRRTDSRYEIGRIGVYSPSMPRLVAKTFGAAHALRALGIAAG